MARITLGHRIQYGTYRTFEAILRPLSVRAAFSAGAFIGKIAFPLAAPLKRLVLRNLTMAFGDEKSPQELERLTKEIFEKTTANLLTTIRLPFLSEEKIQECVTLTNLDILHEAVSKNKGTILLIPHMGNWELLAQSPSLAKVKATFGTHYRPLNNPLLNNLIERRRKQRGVKLFPKRTSSHTLTSFLRENGILGILADQRIPSKGALCPFFGRPTVCSPLPSLLAKRTEAAIIGLHCKTIGKDHWEIELTRVEARDAAACATNIEQAWRSSPSDVFWFQDRWKLPKQKPLKQIARGPFPEETEITQPLKIVTLDNSPKPQLELPDYIFDWSTLEQDSDLPTGVDLWVAENPPANFPYRTYRSSELL